MVKVGSRQFIGVGSGEPLVDAAAEHTSKGETVIWIGYGDTVAGFVALRDEPEPTARDALSQLEAMDIVPAMLSGDAIRTTEAIGAELGVSEVEGGLSPKEKAQRIAQWQAEDTQVGMVGDGVNDAPALAQADLSITVVSGTDVAGETSDIILTQDDLTLIPWLIRLSRRTNRIIRENLGWAFAYNLLAVPLAAFGVISPVIAAGAMAASSLLVVGNSLRLRR
jgi:Cu+-exporting ATPase